MEIQKFIGMVVLSSILTNAHAQNNYRYAINLNNVTDDQLTVELLTPKINKKKIAFYLPKIVPGTYMNSNYGKYVNDLKAYDVKGKELTVKKDGDNSWNISNAEKLYKIIYKIEDTWDSKIDNYVYTMCGTNFEAGKNFVLNTPGVFGYFEGMKKIPFDITFTKPLNFYAATGLKPVSTNATSDNFVCSSAEELYDSPIMYSLPDTTTIRVGNSDVLVAIYSPHKKATSKFIAQHLTQLMMGTKDYLAGKLPVDKYAFIYYFNGEQKKLSSGGAWEHSYSSFYALEEQPQDSAIANWVDISSHEFFHIVTPLTISSRQVKEFNFQETNLSKHVWLYEGSTEYAAHHMQVKAGITTPEKFLQTLSGMINYSRTYFKDSLSFTELGTESAGKWKQQYGNVYLKGALISACLDLYLLNLSGGKYGMQDLKHDLGVKYGKDKFFEDDALFDEIGKLTYPEIKDFLVTYVEGGTPIPYEKYFAMAGVQYIPKEIKNEKTTLHILRFDPAANSTQLKLRNAWLGRPPANVKKVVANANDVQSQDSLIKVLYAVISGPAGTRDWDRFRSLFHPEGYMGAINPKKMLVKFSPEQYISNNAPYLEKYSFYEKEIGRTTNTFGNIAQVFSTYEYDLGTSPPEHQRGINSLEIVFQENRWWILSLIWDEESAETKIPSKFIGQRPN